MYSCNDGGLYYTSNSGQSWVDVSDGLAIAQIYKIGQSAQSRNLVINGYQDNGTAIYDGNWRTEIGGDGMECIVDPADSSYMYGALYYGDIRRSTNYGVSFSKIANAVSETGEWVTPYILREGNPNTMYAGYKNVWKNTSVRSSTSWTQISTGLGASNQGIRVLENSPADDDILYIAKEGNDMYRSDNINASSPTYTNLTSSLPTTSWPRDIEAHPFDADSVFIVQSKKVYASGNKGSSWTDISGTSLPNVNVNCIVYDSSTGGDLYIGTEMGVYFKKANSFNTWIRFNGGMPEAIDVTELEIFYGASREESRIKAATYGRGLWSSPLYTKPTADFTSDNTQLCLGQEVQFTDQSEGFYTSISWTFPGGIPGTSTDPNPKITYNTPGTYTVSMIVSNINENSTKVKTNFIIVDSQIVIGVTPDSASMNRWDSLTLKASGGNTYFWSPAQWINKTKGAEVKVSPPRDTIYTVQGINNDCNDTGYAQAIVTVLPTGIEEGTFNGGKVKIFPNPTSGKVSIQFKDVKEGRLMLSIIDLNGREILRDEIYVDKILQEKELDISREEDAYYILQVSRGGESMIFRILLDH